MFSLIEQVLIILLSITKSLTTKSVSLSNKVPMFRLILIYLNPVKLKYYPFMISLDKCSGICNVLSPKICGPKKTLILLIL